MTYLTHLVVEGLAGAKRAKEFEFDRHVNVFWGLNGSGKTSLLRIIHAACNNEASALSRLPFRTATVHFADAPRHGTYSRFIDMTSPVSEAESEYVQVGPDEFEVVEFQRDRVWETRYLGPGEVTFLPGRIDHTYLPISRVAESRLDARRPPVRATVREALNDAYFDSVFAEQVRRRWGIYNGEANARIREVQQQGLAEILSLLFSGPDTSTAKRSGIGDAHEAYGLVSEFLRRQGIRRSIPEQQFRNRFSEAPDIQQIVAAIRGVLGDIEIALEPQRAMAELLQQLYSGGKRVSFDPRGVTVTTGNDVVPLESLSSGEKQLLQILLETVAAGASPVLIDEPELSMHVDWQHRLVRDLQLLNPDTQLLLATHSPEIMADIPLSQIHEL